LKARRTALKGSATRKLKRLNEFVKHESPNQNAFDQCSASVQQTLNDFRTVLNSMIELNFKLPEDNFVAAKKELEENEKELENNEILAIQTKCEFDSSLEMRKKLIARDVVTTPTSPETETKPKFKPRDLIVSKWNGDLVTINAWKQQINDYFHLTGFTTGTDSKQLAILLYQNALPNALQSSLLDLH